MPERACGDAGCQRLMACDHIHLLAQDLVECIRITPRGSGHERIMRARSDKKTVMQKPQSPHIPTFTANFTRTGPWPNDTDGTLLSL
jgi:hypothetical protein